MNNRKELAEELVLRKAIRALLKERVSKIQNDDKEEINLLREVVQKALIKETAAASSPDAPYDITAMNKLSTLFRDIMTTLETNYKSLTTAKEQRDSFRAHIINAADRLLKTIDSAPDKGKSLTLENLYVDEEISIDIVDDDKEEGYIDIADDNEESEQEEFGKELASQGLDNTGRNTAYDTFHDVKTQIGKEFASIDPDSIVPASKVPELGQDTAEREVFRIYLLKNIGLYFDEFEKALETNPETPELPV
jgi:hypothetical protein